MPPTVNLGFVKSILVSAVPPTNLNMLWYDNNIGQKRHKYYDTITSAWKVLGDVVVKRGTINPAWFDASGDLLIPHNLGVEDVGVFIKDASKITNTIYPYQTIDTNTVKVFVGEVITGEYAIICW